MRGPHVAMKKARYVLVIAALYIYEALQDLATLTDYFFEKYLVIANVSDIHCESTKARSWSVLPPRSRSFVFDAIFRLYPLW